MHRPSYEISPDSIDKAGGWLVSQYSSASRSSAPSPMVRIYLPDDRPETVQCLVRVLELEKAFVPMQRFLHMACAPWQSWLETLIDVYLLAERLESDYVQNTLMDFLIYVSLIPQNLLGGITHLDLDKTETSWSTPNTDNTAH